MGEPHWFLRLTLLPIFAPLMSTVVVFLWVKYEVLHAVGKTWKNKNTSKGPTLFCGSVRPLFCSPSQYSTTNRKFLHTPFLVSCCSDRVLYNSSIPGATLIIDNFKSYTLFIFHIFTVWCGSILTQFKNSILINM